MTDSPAKVFQKLLIQLGLGVAASPLQNWSVFYGNITDNGDNVIFVMNSAGDIGRSRDMDSGLRERHVGINIQVRSLDPEAGAAKAEAISTALSQSVKRTSVVVGAKTYRIWSFTLTSDIIPLGLEEAKRRSMHSLNGTATIEEL